MNHTAWTAGLRAPVPVHGPARLTDDWWHFCRSMRDDIELRQKGEGRPGFERLACIRPLAAGTVIDDGDLTITAIRTRQPPLIETFALRIDAAGKSVVFSDDTADHPPVAQRARGADLLIHEAMLANAIECLAARAGSRGDKLQEHLLGTHIRAEHAARIASAAGVGAQAIHHLIPADDPACTDTRWRGAVRPHWNGQLHVGTDETTISLEDIA